MILPRFCLIFYRLGRQMHCGRQSAAHFELQRDFPHFIFCYFWPGYAKFWWIRKKIFIFSDITY
ncbi:MAG: hypothetical protein EGR79_07500 [Ruminococcaceae bacterium]|nr:hypothetical protein [Oscillospiraceae bacterium]